MKHFILSLLFLCASDWAVSQTVVKIQDSTDEKPVEGVYVMLTEASGKQHNLISNNDGEISLPSQLTFPCKAFFQHLSFETKQETWQQFPNAPIGMKPSAYQLNDVVVTGQIEPQSIDESVFAVRSVDAKTIESQGAVDLSEVLSNQLNLTLTPNPASGRSSISMLGLEGQYIKVLIDGVPFVGANGNGNDVDLSQINLNNVERIEIVEGGMAVSYGANAVAGVINIITKKPDSNKLSLSAILQEETVGDEYGWEKGRHIQTVGLSYSFNQKLSARLDYRRNDFKGFQGERAGEDYIGSQNIRGFEWQPKVQNLFNLGLNFNPKWGSITYKADYFHQKLTIPDSIVRFNEHPATGIKSYFGQDNILTSKRFVQSLNTNGKIGRVRFNILTSYSDFSRDDETAIVSIPSQSVNDIINVTETDYSVLMSRGNLTNFLNSKKVNLEWGYELNHEELVDEGFLGGGDPKSLTDFATFTNAEFVINERLSARAGLRLQRNSLFNLPLAYNGIIKYAPNDNVFFRLGYGRSYRTPNLTELYFYFVDANHNVQGNPNLLPENGHSLSLDTKVKKAISNDIKLETMAKLFYNHVADKIALAVVNPNPLAQQYININLFESQGFSISNQLSGYNFRGMLGISYIGRLNDRSSEFEQAPAEFLYSTEINANVIYTLHKTKMDFGLFLKRTGRLEQYALGNDGTFRKGEIDAFNWLDFTVKWQAVPNVDITLGARNLLNITNVNSSAGESGTHSVAASSVARAYGRSYFLRVGYQFIKK